MSTWNEIAVAGKGIESQPFSLYWNKLKSTDRAFQEFLNNPRTVLSSDLSEVDASWKVQTHIIGHEIGFLGDAVFIVGLVDRIRKTVFLTFYKYPAS